MKTIKVIEAAGPALDWLVAKCEFKSHTIKFVTGSEYRGDRVESTKPRFRWVKGMYTPCTLADAEHLLEIETSSYYCPSTSWGIGGPIIEREFIELYTCSANDDGVVTWRANSYMDGPTPLTAAMRCFVASKLGDTVEVPEELG